MLTNGWVAAGVDRAKAWQPLADLAPLRRLGRAEEIAAAAVYLASEAASFVNAAELVVDGGLTGRRAVSPLKLRMKGMIAYVGSHRRKKNPQEVHRWLLVSGMRLALAHGFPGVGQVAVAADAGVTKGGLIHHFPSKRALVEAVFQDMIEEFEVALERMMSTDPDSWGRFTRAYIEAAFDTSQAQWALLWMATLTDATLREIWGDWFNRQRRRHGEGSPAPELARFAADGVWLGQLVGIVPQERSDLKAQLIDMTRRAE